MEEVLDQPVVNSTCVTAIECHNLVATGELAIFRILGCIYPILIQSEVNYLQVLTGISLSHDPTGRNLIIQLRPPELPKHWSVARITNL